MQTDRQTYSLSHRYKASEKDKARQRVAETEIDRDKE